MAGFEGPAGGCGVVAEDVGADSGSPGWVDGAVFFVSSEGTSKGDVTESSFAGDSVGAGFAGFVAHFESASPSFLGVPLC